MLFRSVQVINDLIANNGLQATPDALETWEFAVWNDERPKQITTIGSYEKPLSLTGSASFAGLTSLQRLYCRGGSLTELDVSNCTQLDYLNCSVNELTKLDLTNCTVLRVLECGTNNLSKIDLTSSTKLFYVRCDNNRLTECDVPDDFHPYGSSSGISGGSQSVSLTLIKDETGGYSCAVSLNEPSFGNSAISYSDGILKSTDSTIEDVGFSIGPRGWFNVAIYGVMHFEYSGTGINTPEKFRLQVYPNPANEIVFIEYENAYIVNFYDMFGKEVLSRNANGKTEMNINQLPKGVYMVAVVSEGETMELKKIIKQ